jgi:hypothetical protein
MMLLEGIIQKEKNYLLDMPAFVALSLTRRFPLSRSTCADIYSQRKFSYRHLLFTGP